MEKETIISKLRHQKELLSELLSTLEMREVFQTGDMHYRSVIHDVERNLRKLRRWGF